MPSACTFCAIAEGSTPGHIVWETPAVLAFLDIRPLFPGHTLVAPRTHHETLEDVPPDQLGELFRVVQRVTTGVRVGTDAQGTFVAMNNVVSQSVPHLHVHVVPRTRGDGLRGFFWPRTGYRDETHVLETAAAVRSAIAGSTPGADAQ